MSRHLIPSPDDAHPGTETVVGWDRQTRTYFLQIKPPEGCPAEAVWLGSTEQFYDLDDFLAAAEEHAVVMPDLLLVALFFDKDTGSPDVFDWRSGQPIPLSW